MKAAWGDYGGARPKVGGEARGRPGEIMVALLCLPGEGTFQLAHLAPSKALPQIFNLVIFQFLEQRTDLWRQVRISH